jgi:hypothetical protein
MPDVFAALKHFRRQIGYEPILFLSLAFIAVAFANQIPMTDRGATLGRLIIFVAGCLFGLGVLIALLRTVSALFTHRPARGLIDGLAAGLLAGVVGGTFGYGLHSVYRYPDGFASPYVEPAAFRVALCVLFATPLGGVVGVFIDLLHPDRQVPWRSYFGVAVGAISLVTMPCWLRSIFLRPRYGRAWHYSVRHSVTVRDIPYRRLCYRFHQSWLDCASNRVPLAMPPQHRLGLHDHQGGAPLAPPLGQEDPKESVPPTELWALTRSGQRGQLLTECEILERDGSVSATEQSDRSEE